MLPQNPNTSPRPFLSPAVIGTVVGALLLSGCTAEKFEEQHDLSDVLDISNDSGLCAVVEEVAPEDCLNLPPAQEGAHFTVIGSDPEQLAPEQASAVEVDEARLIAEVTSTEQDTSQLSEGYQMAIDYAVQDPFAEAALAGGTRIVFEQQEVNSNVVPRYVSEVDAVRVQLFTGKNNPEYAILDADKEPSVGDIRAIVVHESSHAIQDKWEMDADWQKIDSLFKKELSYGLEKARQEQGPHAQAVLAEYQRELAKDHERGWLTDKQYAELGERAALLQSKTMQTGGFDALIEKSPYSEEMTSFKPPSWFIAREVKVDDEYYLQDNAIGDVALLNDDVRFALAGPFGYMTEHKVLVGVLDDKSTLGHGWDNTGEYIASLTAVVEIAPQAYVRSLQELEPEHKANAMELLGAIAKKYEAENPVAYKESNYPTVVEQLAGN